MNITEIRVRLVNNKAERLRAFCSVTFDGEFVIRDLKIIDGTNGPFVAMPSRKLADKCRKCGFKNPLRARFCSDCGTRLKEGRVPRDSAGRLKLHVDVAHPINALCRERLQNAIVEAYRVEEERSKQPGYEAPPLDHEEDFDEVEVRESSEYDSLVAELRESALARKPAAVPTADAVATHESDVQETDPKTAAPEAQPPQPVAMPADAPAKAGVRSATNDSPSAGDFGEGIL